MEYSQEHLETLYENIHETKKVDLVMLECQLNTEQAKEIIEFYVDKENLQCVEEGNSYVFKDAKEVYGVLNKETSTLVTYS